MGEKDYSVRTSHMYDDRDGHTVTDLDGVISVCDDRDEQPNIVRFLTVKRELVDDVPGFSNVSLSLNIVEYANISKLPEPLYGLVKEVLAGLDQK